MMILVLVRVLMGVLVGVWGDCRVMMVVLVGDGVKKKVFKGVLGV